MERHTYIFLDIWKDIYSQSWTYGKTLFWTYGKTYFLILKNLFLLVKKFFYATFQIFFSPILLQINPSNYIPSFIKIC